MKVIGAFLAALWLLFAVTATVEAAPAAEPPCHMTDMASMRHSPMQDQAPPIAMPCCSQPAILPDPVLTAPVRHVRVVHRITLPRLACPTGQSVSCEPQPPKI